VVVAVTLVVVVVVVEVDNLALACHLLWNSLEDDL